MKTQQPEAPQQARNSHGASSPASPALCKTLTFLAAAAAGCSGLPLRPEPFECPERVQRVMSQELGWERGFFFIVSGDDRWDEEVKGGVIFRPGAEVVSSVDDTDMNDSLAPTGTKLWGRVYVDPQDEGARRRGEPAALLVKYERAKLPGKEEVPICAVGRSGKVYKVEKDGAATAMNSLQVAPVWVYQDQSTHPPLGSGTGKW